MNNKIEYIIDQALLQEILDYIGASKSDFPVYKVVALVDKVRQLKPMSQEVSNEEN